jgi:predicted small secreted protein
MHPALSSPGELIMKRTYGTLVALATALLLLSACGTTGGMGDIFGGGSNGTYSDTIHGTVDYVDANARSIDLVNVSGYSNNLRNGASNGNRVRIYFDSRTSVTYQGRSHQPQDLERGDEVDVRVDQNGNELIASAVTVVRDVAENGGSYPDNSSSGSYPSYGSTLRGTVRYVDTSRRTIEVDTGGSTALLDYDTSTPIRYGGRNYNVADLERGDEIDVRITDLGRGRYRADDITVTRSISDGGSGNGTYGNSSSYATVRGTVRYVDTSRRTIELEQTTWLNGFTGGSRAPSTLVVQYGSNATIENGGRSYPIDGLERGDVIEVQVDRNSSANLANRIILVRDIRQ